MIKEVSVLPAGNATKVFLSLLYKTPLSDAYAPFPESTFIVVRLAQLQKAPSPMRLTLLGIVTLLRLVHSSKALSPMLVTLPGMVTLARPAQSLKVPVPMVVTPSGIVTLLRLVQLENTKYSMLETLLGIVTLARLSQREKVSVGIVVKGLALMSRLTYFPALSMAAMIFFSVNLLAFTATVIVLSGLLAGCL
jgi:hypothetical protein